VTLTPEQKKAVEGWVAAGDNLSVVQKKLFEQFKLSLTYRDVRFLVDDLNLQIKDAAPKVSTDLKDTAPEKKGFLDKAKEKLGLGGKADAEDLDLADAAEAFPSPNAGAVSVSVDKVSLIPGAIASGTVTFSDGVTGKWIVDNYGRPGITEISKPGYRPSPADGEAFMQELSAAIQKRGI
jgi:hypothetical protein